MAFLLNKLLLSGNRACFSYMYFVKFACRRPFSSNILPLNFQNLFVLCHKVRASDISRKKKQNFGGFSGPNSRKNRPISRDFRGKKVKIRGTIGRFRAIFEGEKSKFEKNRPISRDFSGKKSIFEGFSGANS